MSPKLFLKILCLLISLVMSACGSGAPAEPTPNVEATVTHMAAAQATEIAAEIYATQTAQAPPTATDTPPPTATFTPAPPTDTPTPNSTNTPTTEPTPASTATPTPAVTATPTLPPPPTPTSDQQWVLVADSSTDYPGPIQGRKWWYLWSEGRNNFIWQDMTETPDCYRSPNEMTLAICPDQMTVDACDPGEIPGRDCSRGDASLQWKAPEGGTYRFEWASGEVDGDTTLRFYKHLDYVGAQGPGTELPYSATVEEVIQWELFFWVPQFDTPYQVKVYKLQE